MNEDYIWDKTGSDARVEKLENALRVFRYTPTVPPELPAKVMALTEKPRPSFFRLGLALAFASAVVIILSVAWFLLPNKNILLDSESVKVIEPQQVPVFHAIDILPDPTVGSPTRNEPPMAAKIRRIVRPSTQPISAVALKVKEKRPPVKLTNEEKYAYGQLMLALSITSSKLMIVRDAIAGNAETSTVVEKKNLYQK